MNKENCILVSEHGWSQGVGGQIVNDSFIAGDASKVARDNIVQVCRPDCPLYVSCHPTDVSTERTPTIERNMKGVNVSGIKKIGVIAVNMLRDPSRHLT